MRIATTMTRTEKMKKTLAFVCKTLALPLLCLGASIFIQTRHIERAEACRDCPFPMLVAPQHWRMPGGYSDVTVQETNLGRGRVQTVVRLIETKSGELLAMGHLDHAKGARSIRVPLADITGGQLEAYITYDTVDRDKVRIKIKCQQCSLGSAYLQ